MRISTCLAICLVFLPVVYLNSQSLDEGLANLSNQIANEMTQGQKNKIAVIEFSDLNGNITEFGKFVAEELITRLFLTQKFEVVERELLNKVLEEHELKSTGLIDPTSAQKLGKILGVESIVSGTVTDLGETIKLNARLISTETGKIFAVAAEKLPIDDTVKKLMSIRISNTNSKGNPKYSGNVFFREDFSGYSDGEAPPDWKGTEHCVVKTKGRAKVFTTFEPGPNIFIIPNIDYPEDFKIKWIMRSDIQCLHVPNSYILVGNISAGVRVHHCDDFTAFIGNSTKEVKLNRNVPITFELEKEGNIFRLLINGVEEVIIRESSFKPSNMMLMNLGAYNNNDWSRRYQFHFDLLLIEGIRL